MGRSREQTLDHRRDGSSFRGVRVSDDAGRIPWPARQQVRCPDWPTFLGHFNECGEVIGDLGEGCASSRRRRRPS